MQYARTWAGTPPRRSWNVSRLIICWISKLCCIFPWNNSIYIIGHNYRLGRVPVVFNKCSDLRPSDTVSSSWLGWRRHARTGKQLFVKSYDLSFQSVTVVLSTYVFMYWIRGTLCGYAIRSDRHISGSQWPYSYYICDWVCMFTVSSNHHKLKVSVNILGPFSHFETQYAYICQWVSESECYQAVGEMQSQARSPSLSMKL